MNADGVLNIRDLGPNAKGTVNVGTFKLAKGIASIDLNSGATKKTAHATVDLNGDGIVNSKDDLLVALDVNGDGVLSALDDVNADEILSKVDLGVNIGGLPIGSIKVPDIQVKLPAIGGLNPRQPPPGVVPPPGSNEPIHPRIPPASG